MPHHPDIPLLCKDSYRPLWEVWRPSGRIPLFPLPYHPRCHPAPLLLFLISWPSKFNIPRGHLAICWEQLVHWLHLFPLSWQKWDSWLSEEGPAWVTAEELGGSGIFPGPLSAGISLSSSSYCSMHDRLINREASCRVKEQRVYSDRRQTEKMVNLCPKDPSCLS